MKENKIQSLSPTATDGSIFFLVSETVPPPILDIFSNINLWKSLCGLDLPPRFFANLIVATVV